MTISSVSGGVARCRVYTKVVAKKDDVWEIYGFATREEREMFEKLTSVSGVGPKMALGVLSALPVRDLALAIVAGDAKALKAAPGIGAKTAQRLLLELRDKVSDEELRRGLCRGRRRRSRCGGQRRAGRARRADGPGLYAGRGRDRALPRQGSGSAAPRS